MYTYMKTDTRLQQNVMAELKWDSSINTTKNALQWIIDWPKDAVKVMVKKRLGHAVGRGGVDRIKSKMRQLRCVTLGVLVSTNNHQSQGVIESG